MKASTSVRVTLHGAALLIVPALLPSAGSGQIVASERARLSQTISGTEIVVDYSRPSARGRTALFGGQIPWGEVWTPGANLNTTLSVSKGVTLNGEEVAAGTYGVWIQVLEDGPWRFLLHSDTTLFHTMHPALEDGLLVLPVERTAGADFVETLRFDLQDLRSDGGRLTLAWGYERISVELGVDPGFVTTVSDGEAARYVGDWILDQSMGVPSEEMRAGILASLSEEERTFFEAWLEAMAVPQATRIHHDDGRLVIETPAIDAIMEAAQGEGFQTILLPRAEGIFDTGTLFLGDLAAAGQSGMWEFDFDDDGRAVSVVIRNPQDDIVGRGTRAGAGRDR